ncbi:MAG: DUF3576 domain-containing protein [Rickettsiales bacterium]|nr:DUF3576 domain-containing protein [Rickettsiales bacterium]
MNKNIIVVLYFMFVPFLANAQTENSFPKSAKQQKSESYGSLFGNNGIQLFGKDKNSKQANNQPTTNNFLWHAALDVIQFMPLASTDFNGGVINTDWYDDKEIKGVRYKVNIVIKSPQLHANALSVHVFKKIFKDGQWQDVNTSNNLATELEDQILEKARELTNSQEAQ